MNVRSHCKKQRYVFFRCLAFAISTTIVGGCAGPQTTQNQAAQGNKTDALPINPLVQELRNQALQGVKFFPMYQPTVVAKIDITAKVKEWRDEGSQDANGQPSPRQSDVFTLEGTSVFMLERNNDTFIASWGIPATDGKITTRGAIWQMRVQDPLSGRVVIGTTLSGVVWTPRVSAIGKLDLTGSGDITTSPDFNFDAFKDSPDVIPFANGYAVNLFGRRLDERGLVDAYHIGEGKGNYTYQGSYVTDDGKRLYGRLIRSRLGKLEEIKLF